MKNPENCKKKKPSWNVKSGCPSLLHAAPLFSLLLHTVDSCISQHSFQQPPENTHKLVFSWVLCVGGCSHIMTEVVIAKQRRRPVKQKPPRFTHLQAVICKPDQLSQIMRREMLLVIDALSKTSKKILNHPYGALHFASYSQGKKQTLMQ